MDKEDYANQFARSMKASGQKFTTRDAKKFISALTKTMAEGLARDRKLIVSNFGAFEVYKFGAKIINSPRGDKKKFFMPPTDIIKWHPSGKVRIRATSAEVSDQEFQKLVGHAHFEPEPIMTAGPAPLPKPSRPNPYEVKINFQSRGKEYLADERSPISRLARAIISEIKNGGADRVEIRPGKEVSEIIYLSVDSASPSRKIPRISHDIIVEKIKTLATADLENPKNLFLPLSETEKILVKPTPSAFGEILVLEMIK